LLCKLALFFSLLKQKAWIFILPKFGILHWYEEEEEKKRKLEAVLQVYRWDGVLPQEL
jgi:hypothetical protein